MSTAQVVDFGSHSYTGPVTVEHVANASGGSKLNEMAQRIAAHFMANMDSDVMRDDQAHSTNLAAKAGLANGGMNFAFGGSFVGAGTSANVTTNDNGIAR